MGFSTKNASGASLDQAKERNFIGYGIHLAAITGHEIKTAGTGSKRVTLFFETPPVKTAGFTPADDAKWGGKVGRASFGSWLASPAAEEELVNKIDLLAIRLGVKDELDKIDESSLEAYMDKVVPLLSEKPGYWKLTGEQYDKGEGKIGTVNAVARYTFFKSTDQVKTVETDAEGNITKVIVNSPGSGDDKDGQHMTFDVNNKYDLKRLEESEEEADEVMAGTTEQGGGPLWGQS